MKKEFWFQIAGSVVILFIALNSWRVYSSSSTLPSSNPQVKQNVQNSSMILTKEEVAKHNLGNDCWLIIEGKVYDITSYMSHPGGRDKLLSFCGQDANSAFAAKGGRGAHSQTAINLLKNFYVGDLNGSIQQTTSQIKQNAAKIKNNAENEDDD